MIRKRRCFGTKEFGINPICRKCPFNKKCSVIFPKAKKLKIKVQQRLYTHFEDNVNGK